MKANKEKEYKMIRTGLALAFGAVAVVAAAAPVPRRVRPQGRALLDRRNRLSANNGVPSFHHRLKEVGNVEFCE